MPQTGVEHMGNAGHKMLGKELKSRENRQKRLKSIGKMEAFFFGYSGAIFERLRNPFLLTTTAQNMHVFLLKLPLR